jgi:uncharacterized membrane protein YcaP (DUF421 family)
VRPLRECGAVADRPNGIVLRRHRDLVGRRHQVWARRAIFPVLALGRRELSGLEPFDLILLVVIGDSVQQALTQDDYSVTGAIIVVGTIAGLSVLVSWIGFRAPRLRPPVLELLEEARSAQMESLDDVKWAVLETSGNISFIKKR